MKDRIRQFCQGGFRPQSSQFFILAGAYDSSYSNFVSDPGGSSSTAPGLGLSPLANRETHKLVQLVSDKMKDSIKHTVRQELAPMAPSFYQD